MGNYAAVLKQPGVTRVVLSQLLARFPYGMLSIVLLVHVQHQYGDFTSAGVILAAISCGQAVAGPLSARLLGTFGVRRVLIVTSILCGGMLATIALAHLPLVIVITIAGILGLVTPPVTSAVRTIYPKLVLPTQITSLFSLDAAAQELIWVIGPVVAVAVSSGFGTTAGLCACAAIMIIGGFWFSLSPAVKQVSLIPSRRSFGAVLRYPTVIIATVIGFFFVGSFSAIEAGIVATFGHSGGGHAETTMESGIVLALFAGGSLVGGLIFGHREISPWSMPLRILLVWIGTALCLAWVNVWWMSVVLFIGGMGTAPVFAAISSILAATVKFSETAEAYGWTGTGQLVGVACGSALAGVAIDHIGATGAILVSAILLTVCALIAFATIRWIPDLRGKTIQAPPETGTITLPLP